MATPKKTSAGREGRKAAFPSAVSPMLCTLTREVHTEEGYVHELKWDGYRIIAYKNKNSVRLASRSGLDYTSKYPPIEKGIKGLKHDAVLDGEIVVHDEHGVPYFDALQKYRAGNPIYYYVFDIMWLDGYSLEDLPLLKRKAILKELVAGHDIFKYSEHFADGEALFEHTKQLNLEGIVSKDGNSLYREGDRGRSWLKTPTEKRQEFVIGGWIESDKNPYFRTLLFGAYNNKKLEWIGHSGSGYKNSDMPAILKKLQAIETDKNPFTNKVDSTGKIHWVKPTLVANFKFATWTKSGRIRKPATFLGWRKDKKATDVVREVPKEEKEISKPASLPTTPTLKKKKLPALSADSNWRAVEQEKITDHDSLELEDCTVTLTNVDREIWSGVTKASLIQYYHTMAEYILPHIQDRPQSLHVKLINAQAPGIYIKDMEGRQPGCAEIFTEKRKHKKAGKRDKIDYLVCNNEATLLFMINLGCVDINPRTSRTSDPDHPDYIVIDLDPSDEDFKKVIKTALAAKKFFDKHKLTCFVKTSGKTGMHLLLPCMDITFPEARLLAVFICSEIHQMVPAFTTTEVSVSGRGTKLYIDPNQNDYADTIATPYCVRPFHSATVSTPLEWKEVTEKLRPSDFTIDNIMERVENKGDLFAGLLGEEVRRGNGGVLRKMLGDF